ncbi:hypothetical protein ACQY0O_005456 [Thecaphora frezii]
MVATKISTLVTMVALAAGSAMATVVVTLPVASTTGSGGERLEVQWKDDGTAPKAADWGSLNIFLCTGSHDVQYRLQELGTAVSTDKTDGKYKIDPTVGPNGGYYFIRFEGTQPGADGKAPMAFSARFTLDNMSGNFNQTVMDQVNGAGGTASPGGGASATKTGASTATASGLTASKSATSTTTAAATGNPGNKGSSTSASSANSTSGAASFDVASLARSATLLTGLVAAGIAFL